MSKAPYTREDVTATWESIKDTPPREPLNGFYHHQDLDTKLGVDELVKKVLEALAKTNDSAHYLPQVFVCGGRLWEVRTDEDGRASIARLQHAGLRVVIARIVGFTKTDGISKCYPPDAVVSGVLEAPEYPGMPALAGITEVPVLRADGSIFDAPGYDPVTHLLYRPVAGAAVAAKVAERPTSSDVADALKLLWD